MRFTWRHLLCAFAIFSIAGCASTQRPDAPSDIDGAHWQGRLSVKTEGPPPQAFAADFDLQGAADKGVLELTGPLGTLLLRMEWEPGQATLRQGQRVEVFSSLQELAQRATNTELPVAALFSWLEGTPYDAPGWEVDLSRLAESGRLQAHTTAPHAWAELKIVLER